MSRERYNRVIRDIVLTLLNVSVHVRKFSGCLACLCGESSGKVAASHGHSSGFDIQFFKIPSLVFQSNLLWKDIHVIHLNVLAVWAAT